MAQECQIPAEEQQPPPPPQQGGGGGDDNGGSSEPPVLPEAFLVVHNIAKKHNVGTLARCATAFGVKQIVLVGSKQINTFGHHGAANHVDFVHFNHLDEACAYLRERGAEIMGIEIVEGARNVNSRPFSRSTAFMMGNEGSGLSEKQIQACDSFVYIPQYGPGTASLNVATATSIVLNQFAAWAQYPERERDGFKFVVAQAGHKRGIPSLSKPREDEAHASGDNDDDDDDYQQDPMAIFEHSPPSDQDMDADGDDDTTTITA